MRLPDSDSEWGHVKAVLADLAPFLRPEASPDSLLAELISFSARVESWWGNRKKGEGER